MSLGTILLIISQYTLFNSYTGHLNERVYMNIFINKYFYFKYFIFYKSSYLPDAYSTNILTKHAF